uniref:Ycf80 n=1 Tax=Kuetzingia canaliculata TaxID=228262 RepID=A0A1Z1MQ10_KUECA|nr:hypothetical protein [Kuetzingia canaliculata]ARW67834.1 hypothetical protein [Kuetzingia canaliculata]
MTLSNLILLTQLTNKYCNYNNDLNFNLNHYKETNRHAFDLNNNRSSSILISKHLSKSLTNIEHSSKFIKRNFWQKLINQYWQETIFISKSNSLFDSYLNKLKSSGLSIYQGNDYKNFLLKFGKDLLNGKIHVDLNSSDQAEESLLVNRNNLYLKYTWFKFFDWTIFKSIFNSQKIHNSIDYSNENINKNTLPLFMLINSNHQLILAESSDRSYNHGIISNYNLKFMQNLGQNNRMYTGLLFVNSKDALEYQEYIQSQFLQSTRINRLKLVASNINFYYRLLSKSSDNIEFRLIPDLKEISQLIYKHRKSRNISFDVDQNYSHNYFQGQPIYLIKPLIAKNRKSNHLEKVNYSYSLIENHNSIKYDAVFLNYETALRAWYKFRNQYQDYKLPFKPKIQVSNLEKFLYTRYYKNNKDKIIFLPSAQTYQFIKTNSLFDKHKPFGYKQNVKNKVLHFKTLFCRIFWSLTSRQPINW